MRYLNLYYDKKAKIDKRRDQLVEDAFANDPVIQREILYAKQNISKIDKGFIISLFIIIVITSINYQLLTITSFIWVTLSILSLFLIIFILLYEKQNRKVRKYNRIKSEKTQSEQRIKDDLRQLEQEKKELIVFIMCINDYYHEMKILKGEKRKKKWQEITRLRVAAINRYSSYLNNDIIYEEYFENWRKNAVKY